MLVGIDFDNTIASYDEVFARLAQDQQLLPADSAASKTAIRDLIRKQVDGDILWQRLQGQVYGPHMLEAAVFPGVLPFLAACNSKGMDVCIVSHKTEYGHFDESRTNLRIQAMRWLHSKDFFIGGHSPLTPEKVFFEETREAKVKRISSLGIDVFIDDLIEVFEHPDFPPRTERILFTNGLTPAPATPFRVYPSWQAITDALMS